MIDLEKRFPELLVGTTGKLNTMESVNINYTNLTAFYRSTQVMAKEHIKPKPLR